MQLTSPRRLLMGSILLAAAAASGSLAPNHAHAAIALCRTDPIVTLSNGVTVTLYEDISDNASDVAAVTYLLHVPAGVTARSIQYTGAIPANLQTVSLIPDEPAGTYDGYTFVTTITPNVPVTASMSANSVISNQTVGHSLQWLHSHITLP